MIAFQILRRRVVDSNGTPAKAGVITGAPFAVDTLERIDKITAPGGPYALTVARMVSHPGQPLRVEMAVPGRSGIFWHSFNWAAQGEGCLGVGDATADNGGELEGGLSDHIADKLAALVEANPGSTCEVVDETGAADAIPVETFPDIHGPEGEA